MQMVVVLRQPALGNGYIQTTEINKVNSDENLLKNTAQNTNKISKG